MTPPQRRRRRDRGDDKPPTVELKGQGALTIVLDEQDLRALAAALEPYISLIQEGHEVDEPVRPPRRKRGAQHNVDAMPSRGIIAPLDASDNGPG